MLNIVQEANGAHTITLGVISGKIAESPQNTLTLALSKNHRLRMLQSADGRIRFEVCPDGGCTVTGTPWMTPCELFNAVFRDLAVRELIVAPQISVAHAHIEKLEASLKDIVKRLEEMPNAKKR